MSNTPNDWNSFFRTCEHCDSSYHASEDGCECDGQQLADAKRTWLADAGYELASGTWRKLVSCRKHTCRRDHSDGQVKTGQVYLISRYRDIDDGSGSSSHITFKEVIA